MAKITRIKASDGSTKKEEAASEPTITRKKVVARAWYHTKRQERKKAEKAKRKETRKREKTGRVSLWRYLKESWQELRQVRWPNARATWKMVLAVLIYTVLFIAIISLLDVFFTWLFNLILGN